MTVRARLVALQIDFMAAVTKKKIFFTPGSTGAELSRSQNLH